jgi:predicted signal transduction protein with EAL and GGDEF domain
VAIAEAVIYLAHALGMRAVAEGVETEEQTAWLARFGCEGAARRPAREGVAGRSSGAASQGKHQGWKEKARPAYREAGIPERTQER